jgi:hypothetical protein
VLAFTLFSLCKCVVGCSLTFPQLKGWEGGRGGAGLSYFLPFLCFLCFLLGFKFKFMNENVAWVGTVKWGNIVFGFNIVTSLPKFLTGHSSLSNEFVGLM